MAWEYLKVIRRRTIARVRSGPAESKTSCTQRNSKRENRETPPSPTKQRGGPEGERDERQVPHERRRGVALRHSIDEAAEQRRRVVSGGCGGKAKDQGEHAAA